MEQLPADDPFRFLFPPRNRSLSQEAELRECPFARESEDFSDSDSQSTWMSSSTPNGIIMESPPDTDPISADKFLTPPEHHCSNVSDSDNLKTPPPLPHSELTVALSGCADDRDDDDFEVESAVHLGTGIDFGEGGDLGFGDGVGKLDLEKEVCDCVIKDHETEVFGSDFGQIGVLGEEIVSRERTEKLELGGGIDCATSSQETENVDTDMIHLNSEETVVVCGDDKTEAVSSDFDKNGILGVEIVSNESTEKLELEFGADRAKSMQVTESVDTETVHLDSEETVVLSGDDVVNVVEEMKEKSRVELERDRVFGAGGGLGFWMDERLDEELCDYIVSDIVTRVGCEFDSEFISEKLTVCEELKLGDLGIGTGCAGNMDHIENTDTDIIPLSEEHVEEMKLNNENLVTHLDLAVKDTTEEDEVSTRKLLEENVKDDKGLNVLSRGQIELVDGENELVDGEGDCEVNKHGNPTEYCQDIARLDEELCDYIVSDIVTRVGCEFDSEFMSENVTVCGEELKLGDSGSGTGCVGNMDHIENTDTDIIPDSKEHVEEIKLNNENLVTHLDLARKDTTEGDEVSTRKLLKENVGDDKGFNVVSRGQNELVDGENELVDGEGDCEVRKHGNPTEYCQDMSGIENCGHKEDVHLRRSGKRKRRGGKRKLQGSDKINLGKSKEDIEKFKYVKPSDGEVQQGKDESQRVNDETVSIERNIPLSNTEKGPLSDQIGLVNLIKKAAELLKRDLDSDTEDDFVETLEKKGYKFPRPSWWPPEGFK